jgi:hypothetical protein
MESPKALPCGHTSVFSLRGGGPRDLPHVKSECLVEEYNDLFRMYPDFRPGRVLEVGVEKGGSLAIWEYLFGCEVLGVDIDLSKVVPACHEHYRESGRITTVQMKMPDPRIASRGPFDLIVDDGGHGFGLVKDTFDILWPTLRTRGLYVIEDWRLSRFEPANTLRFLGGLVLGDDERLQYAMGDVPAKLTVYRSFIAVEKKEERRRVVDPTVA